MQKRVMYGVLMFLGCALVWSVMRKQPPALARQATEPLAGRDSAGRLVLLELPASEMPTNVYHTTFLFHDGCLELRPVCEIQPEAGDVPVQAGRRLLLAPVCSYTPPGSDHPPYVREWHVTITRQDGQRYVRFVQQAFGLFLRDARRLPLCDAVGPPA